MAKDKFLEFLIKESDPEYEAPDDHVGWIDTGSYIFNAALSASIYGGFSDNAISAMHAKEGVGKTYMALSAVNEFLANNPTGRVVYFDTEGAVKKKTFEMRNIDYDRILPMEPETIEKLQTVMYRMISAIKDKAEGERPPMMMVLDSLGMLPSSKERNDAESGKEVRDMTKQGAGRSLFRTITSDLRKLQIPFIVVAHSYTDVMSYGAPQVISGGGGIKYAASTITYLSKSKDQEEKTVKGKKVKIHNGNIITLHVQKSRFSRENTKVESKLDFRSGIDRYYGLLDLASQYDIIKRISTQYEMPDGSKHFKKAIDSEPTKFFNQELLDKIEEAAKMHFTLGSTVDTDLTFGESEIDALDSIGATE